MRLFKDPWVIPSAQAIKIPMRKVCQSYLETSKIVYLPQVYDTVFWIKQISAKDVWGSIQGHIQCMLVYPITLLKSDVICERVLHVNCKDSVIERWQSMYLFLNIQCCLYTFFLVLKSCKMFYFINMNLSVSCKYIHVSCINKKSLYLILFSPTAPNSTMFHFFISYTSSQAGSSKSKIKMLVGIYSLQNL